MQIRFISTLTADDEDRLAEMIVDTAKALLAHYPLGYMLRIETTDAKLFEHNKVAPPAPAGEIPRPRQAKVQRLDSAFTLIDNPNDPPGRPNTEKRSDRGRSLSASVDDFSLPK